MTNGLENGNGVIHSELQNGNGVTRAEPPLARSEELKEIITLLLDHVTPFVASADREAEIKYDGGARLTAENQRSALVAPRAPRELEKILGDALVVKQEGSGKEGLGELVGKVLGWSVNTWDQGFMDKLYASTNAIGVAAEFLLAVLNTNAHVYQVSPVLTLIEKHTAAYLASLFHYPPAHSGGITQPGGSASNSTAIVVARNTLYPETKTHGNGAHHFTLFTSAHGHYSLEKAANLFGLGSRNVISVPVDASGRMVPSELDALITASKSRGETPFFVNATAGTTVHGSYDPFTAISAICKAHNMWLHIDGSWGGSVALHPGLAASRLQGAHLADSIAMNPHKMLGVPVTCSFLLARDLRTFRAALTLPAGYLFHNDPADDDVFDLADLTPQCGRKADSFKLWLGLQYYGAEHYSNLVETAFSNAEYLLARLKASADFVTISPEPVPCLQVCFYYAKGGKLGEDAAVNGSVTAAIAKRLIPKGFMIDFAPGEKGDFFRVVVNGGTQRGTLDGLVKALEETAHELGY